VSARWEIVRTDAGWHVRFVAANGEPVVTGEVLSSRQDALKAIASVCGDDVTDQTVTDGNGKVITHMVSVQRATDRISIYEVDER
jgi:uncharacterized protein YegP (UPF0339 family)